MSIEMFNRLPLGDNAVNIEGTAVDSVTRELAHGQEGVTDAVDKYIGGIDRIIRDDTGPSPSSSSGWQSASCSPLRLGDPTPPGSGIWIDGARRSGHPPPENRTPNRCPRPPAPGFADSEETLPGRCEAWPQRPVRDMLIYDHSGLE